MPATILIRLRAVFRNPVTFSPSQGSYIAEGLIRTGRIAVASKTKVPIAYTTVNDATGKATIFVAKPRCRLVA